MTLKIEVEIDAQHIEPSIVIDSLRPDNIEIPEGVSIKVNKGKGSAIINIECKENRILTCRSTIDEILMLIDSIITSISSAHSLAQSPND